jgi:hypothetical protein
MPHTAKTNPVGRPPATTPPTHTALFKWLLDHPLISIHALEKEAGIKSQGNLNKAINGTGTLPDKYYTPLIEILNKYGYSPAKKRTQTSAKAK